MYDKQRVIDIALAEVNYLEKKTNAQLDDKTANAGKNNYTKYARDLAVYPFYNGSKTGVAWCDVFVDWCFVQAYGIDAALALTYQPTNASKNYGAGCKYSRNYYKNKGRLFDAPEPGDQIFFYSKDKKSISHTGLVYKVDGSKVYTVEGNTSGASGVVANGGGVFKKSYALTYSRLAGFGRPDYGVGEIPASEDKQETLRIGDTGKQVRKLQTMLNRTDHTAGQADGIFGTKTLTAVRSFQEANRLTVDGVVGPKTWAALESAANVKKFNVNIHGVPKDVAENLLAKYDGEMHEEG